MRATTGANLVLAAALAAVGGAPLAVGGCVSAASATPEGPSGQDRVLDLTLSATRSEIGKPFQAKVTWTDNFITHPEVSVSGLPPGLHYDPAKRTVTGTPTTAGFFAVNLAVRQKPPDDPQHRPTPRERWWPASVEVDIYKPVGP